MQSLKPNIEQIIREAAREHLIREFDIRALLGAASDMVRGLHVDVQNKYISRARANAAKKMTAEIDKLIGKYTAEFEKLGGTADDALYAFALAYRAHAVNHAPAEGSEEAQPTKTQDPHPAMAQPVPAASQNPSQQLVQRSGQSAKNNKGGTQVVPAKQNKTVPMRRQQ